MEAFAEAGRRHGLPFACTGLPPMSCPTFSFPDGQLNADVWSLFLQETARRGVLIRRGGLLFVTYSHADSEVEATFEAVDESLATIAEALRTDTLSEKLKVREVREGFRRF
jgi:glutamate-1-semialdehyde aminotransferase